MALDEALHQLESLGTEQSGKIYRRYGVHGPQLFYPLAVVVQLE